VSRDDFPEPDAQVSGKRLWKRVTVEWSAKRTLPLKFDPRSKGYTQGVGAWRTPPERAIRMCAPSPRERKEEVLRPLVDPAAIAVEVT
jgi:hypothetical protein